MKEAHELLKKIMMDNLEKSIMKAYKKKLKEIYGKKERRETRN